MMVEIMRFMSKLTSLLCMDFTDWRNQANPWTNSRRANAFGKVDDLASLELGGRLGLTCQKRVSVYYRMPEMTMLRS